MRSARHKVLHHLVGRPLIDRVIDLVKGAGASYVTVVVGHQADQVRRALPEGVDTVVQEPQLGTGHAVQIAADRIRHSAATRLLVHYGDSALVRPQSLRQLVEVGVSADAPVALLNARVREPAGYGRVIRRPDGSVALMVEELDATPEQRSIDEVWGGSLLIWTDWLWQALSRIPESPKGEYYLPELVNLATADGLNVHAVLTQDEDEVHGVNDRVQLAEAHAILRRRVLADLMHSGVTIIDPVATYIEPEVKIEPDVVIHPGCHLQGRTRIAHDAEIGPNTIVLNSEIGAGSRVWMSVLEGAVVGEGVEVGPNSHLRPGAVIEDEAKIGNYAEVKASRIGAGTQMHHFSYVGDADVGRRVNIAAGTITANFDSESGAKSRTEIGDDASIGSDTILVAPVRIGPGAMTGAGSVVTHDIPAGEVWLGAPARPHRRRDDQPTDTSA
jgi:bifunctional UDP-N-acetylglucosamine pyrophosphorylase/glucosamine-1-phosphate N-acetyltransferase